MKTIEDLLNSEYAERFQIERADHRSDVICIYLPNMISFKDEDIKITEHEGMVWIENSKFSMTLYKESVTTHTVIF